MKRVFVTGGTGFIGRHLVERLIREGLEVTLLVRRKPEFKVSKNTKMVMGDISDRQLLIKALEGIDTVFHLAAKLHVPLHYRGSDLALINIEGTRNLLEAASMNGTARFVFFSSAAVLFNGTERIMGDRSACQPLSEYGRTKLEAERFVREYRAQGRLEHAVILRPVVVYGRGEQGNVVKLIDAIRKKRFVLIGNGENVRSLVHVDNVVEAAILASRKKEADGGVFVVTDKDRPTVRTICEIIARHVGQSMPGVRVPTAIAYPVAFLLENLLKLLGRPSPLTVDHVKRFVSNQICCSENIQKTIGFQPTSFEQGLVKTLDPAGETGR